MAIFRKMETTYNILIALAILIILYGAYKALFSNVEGLSKKQTKKCNKWEKKVSKKTNQLANIENKMNKGGLSKRKSKKFKRKGKKLKKQINKFEKKIKKKKCRGDTASTVTKSTVKGKQLTQADLDAAERKQQEEWALIDKKNKLDLEKDGVAPTSGPAADEPTDYIDMSGVDDKRPGGPIVDDPLDKTLGNIGPTGPYKPGESTTDQQQIDQLSSGGVIGDGVVMGPDGKPMDLEQEDMTGDLPDGYNAVDGSTGSMVDTSLTGDLPGGYNAVDESDNLLALRNNFNNVNNVFS